MGGTSKPEVGGSSDCGRGYFQKLLLDYQRHPRIFKGDIFQRYSLFEHCPINSYFAFKDGYLEQVYNSLSSVVGNLFTEKFENRALNSASMKPKVWWLIVDDTFIINLATF